MRHHTINAAQEGKRHSEKIFLFEYLSSLFLLEYHHFNSGSNNVNFQIRFIFVDRFSRKVNLNNLEGAHQRIQLLKKKDYLHLAHSSLRFTIQ